jgi:hypothetical protein
MKNRDLTIIAIGLYIMLIATLIGILVFTPTNNYDINKDGKVDTLDLLLLKKEILKNEKQNKEE